MWTIFPTASEPLLVNCAPVGAIPRFAGRRRLPVSLTSIHEVTDCYYESIVRIRNSHSIFVPKLTRSNFYKHESPTRQALRELEREARDAFLWSENKRT
jgi:hypothetical protein